MAKKRLAETQEEISAEVAAKVSMADKLLLFFLEASFSKEAVSSFENIYNLRIPGEEGDIFSVLPKIAF